MAEGCSELIKVICSCSSRFRAVGCAEAGQFVVEVVVSFGRGEKQFDDLEGLLGDRVKRCRSMWTCREV